ncbi:hypothetical protein HS041_15895 [Planomonospora sp. ID67723]|uniref:hypothetical protein n=1 Tax=Planomonospora sp. ID67723 TaxID=2738134 RepID=UPI0018C36E8E|nr:hypothetical protein [Planomonospora sp. ID67723]MBG0829251.1 hypothetical protein [Planomonospora sp. ID67723]
MRRFAPAAWAALVVAAFAAGAVLHGFGALAIDHLPPLHGHFRVLTVTLLPAAAFAAVAVAVLPPLVVRSGFGRALAVTYGCALAWTVLLAVSADGLAAPFTHPEEYPAALPAVGGDPLGWLAGFTERLPEYPTHVRGHPPLPVLVVWALAAAGLPGPLPAALLAVLTGCSASVAIALTVRRLSGEEAARRALPYLALTPASVWIATSMDAFFAGVGAWGVALLVLGRGRAARIACAAAGGTLLGALPYLSYGLVPYLLIPVAVAVAVRPPRAAVLAALAGAASVTAAFAAGGFLWPAGVLATHAEWAADPGAARPYLYFLVANLAVLALLTGPATAAGLARLAPGAEPAGRAAGRGVGVVVAAALVAVLALDVSGVTRGEVERIWVPYALWIGLAASLTDGRRPLAAQALTGLLLQGLVVSPW